MIYSVSTLMDLRKILRNAESDLDTFSYLLFLEKDNLALDIDSNSIIIEGFDFPLEDIDGIAENIMLWEHEMDSLVVLFHAMNEKRDIEAENRIFSLQDEVESHNEMIELLISRYSDSTLFEQMEDLKKRWFLLGSKMTSFVLEKEKTGKSFYTLSDMLK